MNTTAALKTLAIVLGIGALTGWHVWKTQYGGTPEQQAQRAFAQCVKERQAAAWRDNPLTFGHHVTDQNARIKAECAASLGNVPDLTPGAADAPKPAAALLDPSEPPKPDAPHYDANGQAQTESREACLAQLDADRKRSPGGLNPAWEKRQKARCDALYSDAAMK